MNDTTDPRERIETKHIRCNRMTPDQWVLAAVGQHAPALGNWPEVVAFAKAIVAANAAWAPVPGEYNLRGFRDKKGGDPEDWPEDLRVREFPEVRA